MDIRKQLAWVFTAIALLVVPGALNYFHADVNIYEKTGGVLGQWLMLSGIAYLSTRKRSDKAKANGALIASVLLLLLALTTVFKEYDQKQAIRSSVSNIQRLNDGKDLVDNAPTANNLANVMNGLAKQAEPYYKRIALLAEEMSHTDLRGVFEATIFTDDALLLKTQTEINSFKKIANNERDLMAELIKKQSAYIDEFNMSKEERDAFLKGFNTARSKTSPLLQQKYAVWEDIVKNVQIILDMAKNNFGKIEINNDGLIFPSQQLADQYNNTIAAIKKNSDDEDMIVEQLQKRQSESIQKMDKL